MGWALMLEGHMRVGEVLGWCVAVSMWAAVCACGGQEAPVELDTALVEAGATDDVLGDTTEALLDAGDDALSDVHGDAHDAEDGGQQGAVDAGGPPAGPPPDGFCMALCQRVYDPSEADYCDETTALRARWPTQEACAEACAALSDEGQRYRFIGCVYGANCGDVALCEAPPAEDFEACEGGCDAIFELCGQLGGITELATCPPLCTGIFMHFPSHNPDAAACIAAEEACGAVPVEDSFGIVLDCMLEAPPSCTAACQAIIPCVPEQDLTQGSCETYCAMGGLGDPDTVGACIEAASDTNCQSVFACLDEESSPVPPLCAAMCGKLTTTCQLPGFACEQGCAAEMEEGSGVSAAGKICVLMAECSEIDACQQLDDQAVPAGCQSACAATPEACGDLPGGCEAACQGVMAAQPGIEGAADCIMATAGAQCALEQIGSCF